jgi:hypothetical protein
MAREPSDSNKGMGIELLQLAELRDQIREMSRRLDKQTHMMRGLWQFMKAEFKLQDKDLASLVQELAEMPLEEAPGGGVENCPKCEEPVKGTRSSCFWCGHEFPEPLFQL